MKKRGFGKTSCYLIPNWSELSTQEKTEMATLEENKLSSHKGIESEYSKFFLMFLSTYSFSERCSISILIFLFLFYSSIELSLLLKASLVVLSSFLNLNVIFKAV